MGKETTKLVIAYAFKELLAEKPYNKITINDIAQKCDINRQTFYYHFHDIIELIEWICETEGESALKKNTTYATWQEGFLGIFEILRQDKVFVTNIYRHTPIEYLNRYLYRV
ncbi:MAG: TetR family transcriptional regulator, partial [Paludibacteraceae bacterium]|nr:TetR family transcriptional regulator [Paludibacteraceae bacterium]